ncbi:uncharacterized protein LOC134209338 [Armigeres subalbatus]|uniref:uncharacterized protein LOC134209338 n=1 Tax=Armigeres subalbatus TaxID=124917 RepID=UPI002ED3B081
MFKAATLALNKAIKENKKYCFDRLYQSANSNPWGDAYRVVIAKTRGTLAPLERSARIRADDEEVARVTVDELMTVAKSLETSKAPAPDGIPNIAFKAAIITNPDMFRSSMQRCLDERTFPDIWKKQRLVLLPKSGKPPGDPTAFIPICLIDTVGKLLEKLTDCRQVAIECKQRGIRYCAVIILDERNALNSACWMETTNSLCQLGVPVGLYKILGNYFQNLRDKRGLVTITLLQPILSGLCCSGTYSISLEEEWLRSKKLQLPPHKTEMIVVNNRKSVQEETSGCDISLSFKSHVEYVCKREAKAVAPLPRTMANGSRVCSSKRRLLASVAVSILRYGGPVWVLGLSANCNVRKLESIPTVTKSFCLRKHDATTQRGNGPASNSKLMAFRVVLRNVNTSAPLRNRAPPSTIVAVCIVDEIGEHAKKFKTEKVLIQFDQAKC